MLGGRDGLGVGEKQQEGSGDAEEVHKLWDTKKGYKPLVDVLCNHPKIELNCEYDIYCLYYAA